MIGIETVLIVSADPERRAAWAARMEARGHRVLRCAGPTATSCALLQGSPECPLQAEASLALYDEEALRPIVRLILRTRRHPPIAIARARPSGGYEPEIIETIAADARVEECFGAAGGAHRR
jgi:hypothetical protein